MTHVGTDLLCFPILAKWRFLAVGLFLVMFFQRLVILMSLRVD
jgi:hypothetical protein